LLAGFIFFKILYIGKQLVKVANIVNLVRKSVNATSLLQSKKIP